MFEKVFKIQSIDSYGNQFTLKLVAKEKEPTINNVDTLIIHVPEQIAIGLTLKDEFKISLVMGENLDV